MKITSLFSRSKGAEPSFETLLAPHVEPLYRLAFRFCGTQHEAEDLVQDLLVKLYPKYKELVQIENLRPWLARTLRNHFIDMLRQQQRSPIDSSIDNEEVLESQICHNSDPYRHFAMTQLQGRILVAMESLNEEQKTLIMMHDIESYTLAEIAEIIDTPIGTLKSRLHRGRARLREILEEGTISVDSALLESER
jgi:RNA polymerase sigma factor (sigma-70 family)